MSSKFELIELKNFEKQLTKKLKLSTSDRKRVEERIQQDLGNTPYRGTSMQGVLTISGRKIAGLRHMKIGVANYRGGLAVLYRICEECMENKYYGKPNLRCEFCDEDQQNRVVLFNIHKRQDDYR